MNFSSPAISETEIDVLISETADLIALEQIAAINAARLSDAPLPSNLESRFQKLKSLPLAQPEPLPISPKPLRKSVSFPVQNEKGNDAILQESEDEISRRDFSNSKRSPSPTKTVCCFGFSLKKNERRDKGVRFVDDEMLKEIGSDSYMKKQRKGLKKMLKEQEKIAEETGKMVDWVKQVSLKINDAVLDELMKEEYK